MDIKEFKQRYLVGERNFSGVDLSGLCFKSMNLDGVDFGNANLKDNLSNITIFRLGETQVHVYLVAQTKNGNWIGIHTISIET